MLQPAQRSLNRAVHLAEVCCQNQNGKKREVHEKAMPEFNSTAFSIYAPEIKLHPLSSTALPGRMLRVARSSGQEALESLLDSTLVKRCIKPGEER